ncbi:MAG TPA: type II toxin-antitoxin system HicA family toxin [Streptosporangiaceae bacterium]|nr:type II toxin-antitoxin system HicA family toxin [Streptosporangiaceae bacterium]
MGTGTGACHGEAVTGTAYGWLHAHTASDHRPGLVRALGKLGWVVVAQKGSHAQLKHPARGGRVTVPLHAGETIGPGLLRSILSQAGITAEELRSVL